MGVKLSMFRLGVSHAGNVVRHEFAAGAVIDTDRKLSEGTVIVLLTVGSVATFFRDLQVAKHLPADSAVRYLAAIAVIGAGSNVLTFWALGSGWYPRRALGPGILAVATVVTILQLGSSATSASLVAASIGCAGCQVVSNLAVANGRRTSGMLCLLLVGIVGPLLIALAATTAFVKSVHPSRYLFGVALYLTVQALITMQIEPAVPRTKATRHALAPSVLGWSIAMQLVVTVGRLVTASDKNHGVAILGAHAWTSMLAFTALLSLYLWRRSSVESINAEPAGLVASIARRWSGWIAALVLVVAAAGALLLSGINSVVGQHVTQSQYATALLPPVLATIPVLILSLVVRAGQATLFNHPAVRMWTVACFVVAGLLALSPALGRWANGVNTLLFVAGMLAALASVRQLSHHESSL